MKIALIDLETTGDDPELDVPVEICIVTMDGKRMVGSPWSSLVHPGDRPISPVASAVHHITLRTYKDQSHMKQLNQFDWETMLKGSKYLVAHNAAFDAAFVPVDKPWICTYRCARHIWPDAPKYSLQALRYWLDLAPDLQGSAHRALYDTLCLKELWIEMKNRHTTKELFIMTGKPVLMTVCHFGKHRGTKWSEVPKDYLRWIIGQDFDEDTAFTAQHYLGATA